jgi:hypothetical protein
VTPLPDIVAEADRLLVSSRAANVPIRLLGGLAIQRQVGSELAPALRRPSADIDLATPNGRGQDVVGLLTANGYAADSHFNAVQGQRRLVFYDDANARKVDVFVGTFEMCHAIPVSLRIDVDPDTIPLAELLLTKLQVVELNDKDLRDMVALLLYKDVTSDDAGINASYIAQLLGGDWGLWRTTRTNLERIRDGVAGYDLEGAEQRHVHAACDTIWAAIEAEPKSRQWRLRSRIGDRKRWYELPEEVE